MKTILAIIIGVLLAVLLDWIWIYSGHFEHKYHIIKSTTDERGLTSIIFTYQDTVGLDYLTAKELDSLKEVLK